MKIEMKNGTLTLISANKKFIFANNNHEIETYSTEATERGSNRSTFAVLVNVPHWNFALTLIKYGKCGCLIVIKSDISHRCPEFGILLIKLQLNARLTLFAEGGSDVDSFRSIRWFD